MASPLILSVFTACSAMPGSGPPIVGIRVMWARPRTAALGWVTIAPSMSCAAVRSTMCRSLFVRRREPQVAARKAPTIIPAWPAFALRVRCPDALLQRVVRIEVQNHVHHLGIIAGRKRHRGGEEDGVAGAERDVAKYGVGAIALFVDDFRFFDPAIASHDDMNRDLKAAPAKGMQVETPMPHDLLAHEVAHAVGGLVSRRRSVAG